jgi:hypothetical protein
MCLMEGQRPSLERVSSLQTQLARTNGSNHSSCDYFKIKIKIIVNTSLLFLLAAHAALLLFALVCAHLSSFLKLLDKLLLFNL